MKKLLTIIVPVLLIFAACDNKPTGNTEETTKIDTPVVEAPKEDVANGVDGTASTPAQVFDDADLKPIGDATVTCTEGRKSVGATKTDAEGMYDFKNLVSGTSYTFTAEKSGYTKVSQDAVYEGGQNSLPAIGLAKTK